MGALWPPPPFPISSMHAHTYAHRAHLTRHGYPKQQEQLICCSLARLAVICLALFTHTHSLPLSVKCTRAVSESLHTQTGEWMLWGLISVLRGLAATSQAHIPSVEATETNLCDQSADEHGLCTAADDLWNAGGPRGAPTMSAYTGPRWPAAATTTGRKEHNRNTEEPDNADSQGPRRTGPERQLPLSRFLRLSLALKSGGPTWRRAHSLLNISTKTQINTKTTQSVTQSTADGSGEEVTGSLAYAAPCICDIM